MFPKIQWEAAYLASRCALELTPHEAIEAVQIFKKWICWWMSPMIGANDYVGIMSALSYLLSEKKLSI
jgi:hypothetical protein